MYQLKRQIPPANSMKKLWKKEKYICTRRQIWRHLTYTSKRSKRSPVAMTPHKSKSYRCLLDISFHMPLKQKLFESVNAQTNKQRKKRKKNKQTNKQSKAEAMVQLGMALRQLIATMEYHRELDLPFLFSKLDIKGVFWCMAVSNKYARNFCYVPPLAEPCQFHWLHRNCGPQQPTNGLVWNSSFLLL